MIAERLRKSILQAAIQGKLTEQMPEDGDARELLAKINVEKEQLIKEGKIKREKPLPEITDDEIPFEIPKNWCWVRLQDVSKTIVDGDHQPPPQTSSGVPFLVISDISSGALSFNDTRYVSKEYFDNLQSSRVAQKGDILFTVTGSYGIPVIVNSDISFCFQRHIALLKTFLDCKFMHIWLSNPHIKMQCDAKATGTAQKTVGLLTLKNMIIPLPPLSEQKRIVEKLDEILPQIDILQREESKLNALQQSFPKKMKDSLLQSAIQGKLTDQLESDGDAHDLVAEIQMEKTRLIKEKKIKKEKDLPEIKEEEIPFEIPENWCWLRLGQIGSWAAGATPNRANKEYYDNGTIPWLKTGDLNDGVITDIPECISELALSKTSVKLQPKGAVLIAMYGATIGKLGILNIEATTNQACCGCVPYDGIYNWYLFYYLMSHKKEFIDQGAGGAQPNISREKIVKTLIPIPPLAEQQRIVERLDQLLPLCDELE